MGYLSGVVVVFRYERLSESNEPSIEAQSKRSLVARWISQSAQRHRSSTRICPSTCPRGTSLDFESDSTSRNTWVSRGPCRRWRPLHLIGDKTIITHFFTCKKNQSIKTKNSYPRTHIARNWRTSPIANTREWCRSWRRNRWTEWSVSSKQDRERRRPRRWVRRRSTVPGFEPPAMWECRWTRTWPCVWPPSAVRLGSRRLLRRRWRKGSVAKIKSKVLGNIVVKIFFQRTTTPTCLK